MKETPTRKDFLSFMYSTVGQKVALCMRSGNWIRGVVSNYDEYVIEVSGEGLVYFVNADCVESFALEKVGGRDGSEA